MSTISLFKSPKFAQEIKEFETVLNSVTDDRVKLAGEKIYKLVLEQVTLINEAHSSYNNGYIRPTAIRENIKNLVDLRRKMTKFIKEVKNL